MKRFFRLVLTLTLGALLPTFVQADTLPLVGNVMARKTTSLNGEWNYIVDVQEEGLIILDINSQFINYL